MNFDRMSEHRVPPWVIVLIAIVTLWYTFSGSTASGPVVSGWRGEGLATQSAAGAIKPAQQAALTGLFSKQNAPQSTGLASDTHSPDAPWGNPTDTTRAVLTQGYGVGSHAPAAVWGGIDIAVDGDGDGNADPTGSMGAPLYATMSGVVQLDPNSMPAGNHLWIKNGRYKVGYGHLQDFAVQNGQTVNRGDLIGYMGSTGNSSGPHLHYHIWQDGINVNPLDFGAMP